ncbi:MAG: CCA tRNA nucleotidyltransferase [Pseudonocardiales bacterium]|nr:MAG: CCA tRNA nucleotidyltransferase [Pseudonocardiales bacterium]
MVSASPTCPWVSVIAEELRSLLVSPSPSALGNRVPATSRAQHNAIVELLRIAPVADELAARFAAAGHQLYLVGGSVRDALLGRLGNDLDFTTDARPEAIQAILAGWADAVWDTGIAFGTVGATRAGIQCEITTYRADRYDRVSRNPDVIFGDTVQGDLARRDFTVNAMAVALPLRDLLAGSSHQDLLAGSSHQDRGGGGFVDPHDGMAALARRELDTPATPEESFADDPLRMLRAARFVSQLGFTLAPRVRDALSSMAGEISRITVERVSAELSKLMLGANPRAGVELMVDTGLAEHVLPEVPAMRLEIDEHHQHKDVYTHSLIVLEQAIALEDGEPDLVLRLAALLHDIGKPATRRHEGAGGVSFHHHEVVGAKMVRKRLRALRYPTRVIDEVATLVFLHLRFHGYGGGEWTDSAVRRYVTDAGDLLPRLHKLVRADCTTRNRRKALALQRTYDDLEARIERIRAEEDLAAVRPDLDGNAIMELLGLPPGPLVGQAWRHLKEVRLDRGPLSRDEAEAELRQWAQDNLRAP